MVRREPYGLRDLERIVATSICVAPIDIAVAGCGPTAHRLPFLACFTGAWLKERGQLLVGDFKQVDGVWCIHITDSPDEDDEADRKAWWSENDISEAVKTSVARRYVPTNAELIRCSLLDFVGERRREGFRWLFPELKAYRGRTTKEWSKFWARHTDEHVTDDPCKTSHSFRHRFVARLRAAGVDRDVIEALIGHANWDHLRGQIRVLTDGRSAFMLSITKESVLGEKQEILVVGPYPDWDLAPMDEAYRVRRLWEAPDRDAFLRECAGVRAVATRGELGASRALMDALPRLEIVACYGVGTDAIDLGAARERGIRVTNTPGVLTEDVADMAIALTLATLRRVTAAEAHVRSGRWTAGNFELVRRFHGCKLGIAGYGRIGAAVAKRAAGFDVEIGYFDKIAPSGIDHRRFETLADLAAWCDVLVVTLAGGPGMEGIVDRQVLEALGPEGFLVNVSRGVIVDEPALLDALEHRRIAGAGLDVFLGEPRIDPRFAALENVVLQPHHSSGTIETRRAMGQLVRDNLAAHFADHPLLTQVV